MMVKQAQKHENSILLYQDENGITNVNMWFSDEDVGVTKNQIAVRVN